MNLRLLTILSFILLNLTGCSGGNVLIPAQNDVKEIKNIQITYILPPQVEEQPCTFNGLKFQTYNNRGTETKIERLYVYSANNGLKVERRTDNGVAGSGVIYTIDANVISKSDNKIVTLTPKTQETYQQGLILPFPIPNFDIETYLSTAKLNYKFELNSDYQVASVKANFDRILGKSFDSRDIYKLVIEDEEFEIETDIYPYRNGSKIVITTTIYNKKSKNGVINVVTKIEKLKRQIEKIINS